MKNQIVLGSFFGDEGKGATVQWLCKKAIEDNKKPIVIRFSGGPQAGHRVINGNVEHVCSSFGSGVLLNAPTILSNTVMVDPIAMKIEYDELKRKGIVPKIHIQTMCRVITPYDVLDNINDSQTLTNGSCGMGIYSTFKRYRGEIFFPGIAFTYLNSEKYLESVRKYYKIENSQRNLELENKFIEACDWIKDNDFITILDLLEPEEGPEYVYIWEGSQGLLLDRDCGFMPNCTPSKVGLNGINKEYLQNSEVFFVMRSYLTRHGNGFIPIGKDIISREYANLEEPTNKTDKYQGVFKIGVFDLSLLKRVNDRHCLDNYKYNYNLKFNIVMNHIDCIKDKFYYTEDGKTISWLQNDDNVESIKIKVQKVFDFDSFYAGFKHDDIVEI